MFRDPWVDKSSDIIFGIHCVALFYLCAWKFSDLKFLSFLQGIMSAPEKKTAPHTFCTSKHAQSASGANCPDPLFRDHNVVKTNLHLINSNN